MYARVLYVSTPKGEEIKAKVARMGERMRVQVDPLGVVKKDNPPFAKDGAIDFVVPIGVYEETIIKLEKYLEDLFLKGMSDEDLHRSLRTGPNSRGDEKSHFRGKTRSSKGERYPARLHPGTRRNITAKSGRARKSNTEVAKGSDQNSGREDKERN